MKRIIFFTSVIFLLASVITPIQAQQIDQPEADKLFTGITLYENGQFEEAARFLEKFINQSDNQIQKRKAKYYLALSQAAFDPDQTITYFDRFIDAYPSSDEAGRLYVDLAHRYSYEGDLDLAIGFYEKALDLQPGGELEAQILFWNAESYVSKRNFAAAHRNFYRISRDHPRSDLAPLALYNQGRLFLQEERYDRASDAFEALRRRYPAAQVTRRIGTALGEAYYRQARYRDAIQALRGTLATLDHEQESKAVLLIAESYNYLEELDEAATWYRRFINMNEGKPEERFAHYGLGWVFHKQGVYHWAADSFSRAAVGDDEHARKALYYKAVNRKLSGRYDLALEAFQEFGRKYTSGPWVETAFYEWAIIAFEIGDYVTAIERTLHLIRSKGDRLENPAEVYSLLGEAYFANAEYARAIEAFERAERYGEADPDAKRQARFQRAWVLYQNQAYRDAQPIFEEIYEEAPRGPLAGEALFWSADSHYNMDNFGPAASRFQRFISEFPDHEFIGAARYSLGWSYFKQGQFEQAIPPLREFLNKYDAPPIAVFPYDVDTKLRLGDALFALRRYDEAMSYYDQASRSDRGADYATYQIASSYYRKDQTFEAVRTFRGMITDFPQSTLREQAQYNIGYIYLLAGNYTQAVREFETKLELFPNSRWAARAQFNIGNAYYNAGDNERAIEAYKKVLERYPRSEFVIEAVNGIQFAQEAAGRDDTSNQILEDFIAENPQAGTADRLRFRQAERLLQTGLFDEAISAFRQYIRVTNNERNIPEAWYYIADAYMQKGSRDEAVTAYQTIINDYPNATRRNDALLNLATLHLERGQYNEALRRYEQLAESSRTMRFDANVGMGNASLGLRNFDRARQYFETARSIGGDEDVTQLGLAKVAKAQGQTDRARDLFRQVADRNNREPGAEAQYNLGLIHQERGSHDAAIQSFANVRIFYGAYGNWVSRSMLGSARSNLALGNRTEAENIVRMIREEYPDTDVAREAQRLLRD